MEAAEARWSGRALTIWTELIDHLCYLIYNVGMTLEELQEREDDCGEMGL